MVSRGEEKPAEMARLREWLARHLRRSSASSARRTARLRDGGPGDDWRPRSTPIATPSQRAAGGAVVSGTDQFFAELNR